MDEITRATVVIEPTAESSQPTIDPQAVAAELPEDLILGRDDGPPLTLDLATMLDATFCRIGPSSVLLELADERRPDDEAFDAMLGGGDIDDFDPAALEAMEAHSGLEDAAHQPLPLAAIPELPEIVLAILEVCGDWRVTFGGVEVQAEELRPAPEPSSPAAAPPPPAGPYGEDAARHWATSAVRALVQGEQLELATARDQGHIQTRVAYMLEDLHPGEPLPLSRIVDKLLDMNGVVELYADDDAVAAIFAQHRPD